MRLMRQSEWTQYNGQFVQGDDRLIFSPDADRVAIRAAVDTEDSPGNTVIFRIYTLEGSTRIVLFNLTYIVPSNGLLLEWGNYITGPIYARCDYLLSPATLSVVSTRVRREYL